MKSLSMKSAAKSAVKSAFVWRSLLMLAAAMPLTLASASAQNLSVPVGVAVDANSNIYVASVFGGVTVYGPNLAKKATITPGIDGANSVAIGPDGTIYVANNIASSITEYSPNGFVQTSLTIPVSQPTQVVVGAYNEVYVVGGNGIVSMFDPLGGLRSQVTVVDTETLVITPKVAQFWVANQNSSPSAEVFEMFTIDIAAGANGFLAGAPYTNFLPTRAVANPKSGDTWMTDFTNNHVLRINSAGNAVVKITPASPPYGIALDTTKQRIFVTEPEANEVEVFSLTTLQRIGLLK